MTTIARSLPPGAQGRLPIVLIGGFLGSGKTTLLRQRYARGSDPRTAIIINEFGAVGIDHLMVERSGTSPVLISGGCACCDRLADLIAALRELVEDHQSGVRELDRVVIETSGLADPAPIVASVAEDPMLRHHCYVEGVSVTVDAVNGTADVEVQPEARKQVAVADEIIITKPDLVTPEALDSLASDLQRLSPAAPVSVAVNGVVEPSPRWPALADQPAQDLDRLEHPGNVSATSVSTEDPLDWIAFSAWLSMLLGARGEDVLRVKGIVNIAGSGAVALNGVQRVLHPPEHLGNSVERGFPTNLVFVTRGVEPGLIQRSMNTFQLIGLG